jgi:hypothetical protein
MKDIAPMVIVLLTMMIPIVAILTTHQRKMAALIHGKPESEPIFGSKVDTTELVQEIRQLRAEVAALAIAVDDVRSDSRALQQRTTSEPPALRI